MLIKALGVFELGGSFNRRDDETSKFRNFWGQARRAPLQRTHNLGARAQSRRI